MNRTVHGSNTKFGFKTPHRMPLFGKLDISKVLSDLVSQLYPTGRAFFVNKDGIMDKTHSAINKSFIRILNDSVSTLNSTFPDNENFTIQDCELWEYRYGLVTNPDLSLQDRRNAILRKMARGLNVPARQHKNYIEYQLRTAGFDVYVHENGFIEGGIKVYKTPEQIVEGNSNIVQHGGTFQHGLGAQHGASGAQVIANSYKKNESYSVGSNLWATFFIGGAVLGDMAEIPSRREEEFRELVLKLKPAHLVAYIFVNFV